MGNTNDFYNRAKFLSNKDFALYLSKWINCWRCPINKTCDNNIKCSNKLEEWLKTGGEKTNREKFFQPTVTGFTNFANITHCDNLYCDEMMDKFGIYNCRNCYHKKRANFK